MAAFLAIFGLLGVGGLFLFGGWRLLRASDAGAMGTILGLLVLLVGFVFFAVGVIFGGCTISGDLKTGERPSQSNQ